MYDPEEQLEKHLEEIEAGSSPTASHDDLAPHEASLAELAGQLRQVEFPEPAEEKVNSQRAEVLRQAASHPPRMGNSRWWALSGVAAAMVILVCVMTLVLAAGGLLLGAQRTQRVTLQDIRGWVEVSDDPSDQTWHVAREGDWVRRSASIRTGPGSAVRAVFFDGSSMQLGPDASVTLTSLGGQGKSLQAEVTVHSGQTTHRVVPLKEENATYRVRTPSGMAEVHGTVFQVTVMPDGQTLLAVNTGTVTVGTDNVAVTLTAGEATTVEPGDDPQPPAYSFEIKGVVSATGENTWVVGGVTVVVNDQTSISDVTVGDTVSIQGRILEDGTWLADTITPAADLATITFTGILESIGIDKWVIGGMPVVIGDGSRLDDDLTLGDTVRVSVVVQPDGTWLVQAIESLEDDPETPNPTPTPTATPDPQAQPSLGFHPDELRAEGCQPGYTVRGEIQNHGSPPDDYASNVEISYVVLTGGQYISGLNLTPTTWARIEPGQRMSYTLSVSVHEAWRDTPNGAEIKVRLFVVGETNRLGHHQTVATVTIVSRCNIDETTLTPWPTSTPTVIPYGTPTPTPDGTTTPTATPEETPGDDDDKDEDKDDDDKDDDKDEGEGSGGEMTICHYPPDNPDARHTIVIGEAAWPEHQAHGDTIGPCP